MLATRSQKLACQLLLLVLLEFGLWICDTVDRERQFMHILSDSSSVLAVRRFWDDGGDGLRVWALEISLFPAFRFRYRYLVPVRCCWEERLD